MIHLRTIARSLLQHRHPVRLFTALVVRRLRISPLLKINYRSFVIRFHDSTVSTAMFVEPDCRAEDHDFLERYLRPGDCVVDVGANIGTLALTASSRVGDAGIVYAFEPHPRTFGFLEDNVRLNHRTNIRLFNVAVGDQKGVVSFSSSRADDQNHVGDSSGVAVQATTLDDVINAPVALLKVDVEGYERFVVAGAARTLAQTDCVYIESFDGNFSQFGYTANDLAESLREAGFTPYRLKSNTLEKLVGVVRSPTCENWIAVKDPAVIFRRTGLSLAQD